MRKTAFFIYTLLFLFLASTDLRAQEPAAEAGRLVGVVVDGASMLAIPHATVKNKTRKSSVLADSTGYFSLAVVPGDTLIFEAMSYADDRYIVPEGFSGRHFAFIEVLHQDAVLLAEVEVEGFPSQEQFQAAFLGEGAEELAESTARLDEHLEEITEDKTNMAAYFNDYRRNQAVYYLGNFPPNLHNPQPNHFLNPVRWARFIRDWREGRFSEDALEKLDDFSGPEPGEAIGTLPDEDG